MPHDLAPVLTPVLPPARPPAPPPAATAFGQTTRDVIAALVPDLHSAYALLDFPAHANIGDSAIWMGEIALLRALFGRGPAHVSMHRFDPAQPGRALQADPNAPLFLHGGGNFGDIWPNYQRYRIAVLQANPNRRIIQLPQSLHFSTPDLVEPTKRAIGAHKDFHLILRDEESAEFARREFDCPVSLAPDSAFGIDTAHRSQRGASGMITVLRQDKERRADARGAEAFFPSETLWDWPAEGLGARALQKGILGAARSLPPAFSRRFAPQSFDALAAWRLERGFRHLEAAEVVVTDRLHGHIMGALLGKPTVVIDNFYGKIRRFTSLWGSLTPLHLARDYKEAREIADGLLTR